MKKNKLFGFTLAETLITLVIIGVVAALTIPTLMSKYQEKAMESQFKKAYSILNQAVALNSDYECYSDVETSNSQNKDCGIIWENILNSMKYSKKVENVKLELYKDKSKVEEEGGHFQVSCASDMNSGNYWNKYYLADGSTMFVYASHHIPLNTILDVNGDKGPNKWGYDVFNLELVKTINGTTMLQDRFCYIWEKGGKRPINILTGKKEVTADKHTWTWND